MLKGVLMSVCCTASLFASEVVYSTVVKPVYMNANDTKVSAKLLPTNAIEILEKKDGKVKFSIKGYQNPETPNIIYYSNGQRILALAFSKTAKPDIKIEKAGKNGSWNEVSTVAYTTDGDFVKDVKPLFEQSNKLYSENCSMCHSLHSIDHYSANQWPALFKGMLPRTPITKEQSWMIIQYLQKHASDMKK